MFVLVFYFTFHSHKALRIAGLPRSQKTILVLTVSLHTAKFTWDSVLLKLSLMEAHLKEAHLKEAHLKEGRLKGHLKEEEGSLKEGRIEDE